MMHYNTIPQALDAILAELHRETSSAFDTYTLTKDKSHRDVVDRLLNTQKAVLCAMDLYDAAKRLLKEDA